MAVTTTDRRVQFVQSGSTTEWPVDFYFQQASDLVVITTVDGVDTTLTLDSDYTVTGAGNSSGGAVIIDPALAIDTVLTIYRNLDLTQEVELRNQGGWFPEVHEGVFDKLTMLVQQLKEDIDRKVGVEITSTREPGTYLESCETAQYAAESAQGSAESAQTSAEDARDKAQLWAEEAEDIEVETGKYSALHHASKAETAKDDILNDAGFQTVSSDLQNEDDIGTVASNITDVNTCATDIEPIKAAPGHAAKAEDWAEKAEDVEVETGKYSALHHAAKALEAKSGAQTARDEAETAAAINAAVAPAHYARDVRWATKGNGNAAERLTLLTPSYLTVNINRSGYVLTAQQEIDITDAGSWDDVTATDWTVASNRAGKNFYAYAYTPASGSEPGFILSANSTIPDSIPSGATPTEDNTRKIGGFHCLCADVGTISGNDMSGYVAGDILPQSVWDLDHRPEAEPEGMVYDPGTGKWADIYLVSVQNGELGSVNGATIADGASAETFHWYKFDQWLRRIKKRFPFQGEFVSLSLGSNQGTNIDGGADPGTTGGHSDTAGRRMISNIGCEDCCGALWQWGMEAASTGGDYSWSDAYDSNDSGVAGKHYGVPNRPRFGGRWDGGSTCGSRGSIWNISPLYLNAALGARGVAEPLKRK